MDSKPLAIILAIVITIGAMGAIIVTGGNILTGTSTTIDLLPKTLEVISIDKGHLEINVLMVNQGTSTIYDASAVLDIDNFYRARLTSNENIAPYETLVISGTAKVQKVFLVSGLSEGYSYPPGVTGIWDVYPGETVLLRVTAYTTSGDIFEKIYPIIVK